jgi:hypothetical protein
MTHFGAGQTLKLTAEVLPTDECYPETTYILAHYAIDLQAHWHINLNTMQYDLESYLPIFACDCAAAHKL